MLSDHTPAARDRLDTRRRAHERLAARLAAMSDAELAALAPERGTLRGNVHGNEAGIVEIDGARLFVKKIALTDTERAAGRSTANLFGLPLFYHYGVGSSGFGAWREPEACVQASDWVLAGAWPHFPLVHHWRILPRTAPALTAEQLAWLEGAPAYWENFEAIRARLAAIPAASACVVVVQEFVPQMLHGWLRDRLAAGLDEAAEAAVERFHGQWQATAAFMNDRGVLHFDLNAFNVLTDGEDLYVADFGLAIRDTFDLAADERAFFAAHGLYDRAYVAWAFCEWLAPRPDPPALTPALDAMVARHAPAAKVFRRFVKTLATESKQAPFPATALAAALDGTSGNR